MKRLLDFIFSLVLFLLLLPLLLVFALVILICSSGPALYWSDRVGRENKIFKMPKFRSMQMHTPEIATHLLKHPLQYSTPIS